MVALLDANVLVALFDPEHTHHSVAHTWFANHRDGGWATCPITENALVRILSSPKYPGRRTTAEDVLERLRRFRESGNHEFWPDSVSLCDEHRVDLYHLQGHRQLTDIYLLSLAVEKQACLATFDRGLSLETVKGAGPEHVERLSDKP